MGGKDLTDDNTQNDNSGWGATPWFSGLMVAAPVVLITAWWKKWFCCKKTLAQVRLTINGDIKEGTILQNAGDTLLVEFDDGDGYRREWIDGNLQHNNVIVDTSTDRNSPDEPATGGVGSQETSQRPRETSEPESSAERLLRSEHNPAPPKKRKRQRYSHEKMVRNAAKHAKMSVIE